MTLALAKEGFRVHASDAHEDLILMWQALMRGETEPFADVTEAEYSALKTAPPSARRGFVGFGASFGGGWFNGYGRLPGQARDVWAPSQRVCFAFRTQPFHKPSFNLPSTPIAGTCATRLVGRPVAFYGCSWDGGNRAI